MHKAYAKAGKKSAVFREFAPGDLTTEEGAAFDVAFALARGGQLPESTYRAAIAAFGEQGTAELIYLVGFYCLICVLLNGYDVAVPQGEEGAQ